MRRSSLSGIELSSALSLLEDPFTTSLPYGIPYGVLPGNHDQESTYDYYNQYFGVGRFSGRSYYGGSFSGTNNNNNYGLFSASGMDFIVINLEYNPSTEVLNWANALLGTYSNRRAIVVSHQIINIGNPGTFDRCRTGHLQRPERQSQLVLDALRSLSRRREKGGCL